MLDLVTEDVTGLLILYNLEKMLKNSSHQGKYKPFFWIIFFTILLDQLFVESTCIIQQQTL